MATCSRESACCLLQLAACLVLMTASTASAVLLDNPHHNLLTNGDFEHPGLGGDASVLSSSFAGPTATASEGSESDALSAGSGRRRLRRRYLQGFLPSGWSLAAGALKYVRGDHWQPASGNHSVALNDGLPGGISQRFRTVPGASYFVVFHLSGDPGHEDDQESGNVHRTLNITIASKHEMLAHSVLSFDTFAVTSRGAKGGAGAGQRMGWEEHTLFFVATRAAATLTFLSTTPGDHGPTVDNVQVYKRDATFGFFKSPNTAYQGEVAAELGPGVDVEMCARACLEAPACTAGFSIDTPWDGAPAMCRLYKQMKKPVVVPLFRTDSYILKDAECSFGHDDATDCPHMLPLPGLLPLACVARQPARRAASLPFRGRCQPMQHTGLCHMSGGYFTAGMVNIGSPDEPRKCSCVRSPAGVAGLHCSVPAATAAVE